MYTDVARVEGYAIAKSDGNRQQQLQRSFEHTAVERASKIASVRARKRAAAEELVRLSEPSLRASTFTALQDLTVDLLKQQLYGSARSLTSAARRTGRRSSARRQRRKLVGRAGACGSF